MAKIDRHAEEVGTIQNLRHSFNPILNVVLASLDASAIFMRTKALKALGQIVVSDPTILAQQAVRRGIEGHLLDNSAAVRDAAVELIGKYMIDSPEVASGYFTKIADRIAVSSCILTLALMFMLARIPALLSERGSLSFSRLTTLLLKTWLSRLRSVHVWSCACLTRTSLSKI